MVAVDPALIGAKRFIDMRTNLEEDGLELIGDTQNYIDLIWTEDNGRETFPVSLQRKLLVYICAFTYSREPFLASQDRRASVEVRRPTVGGEGVRLEARHVRGRLHRRRRLGNGRNCVAVQSQGVGRVGE